MSDISQEHIDGEDPAGQHEEHSVRGTFIILIAYLVVIVGIWGTMYFTLLSRG